MLGQAEAHARAHPRAPLSSKNQWRTLEALDCLILVRLGLGRQATVARD